MAVMRTNANGSLSRPCAIRTSTVLEDKLENLKNVQALLVGAGDQATETHHDVHDSLRRAVILPLTITIRQGTALAPATTPGALTPGILHLHHQCLVVRHYLRVPRAEAATKSVPVCVCVRV
jgi:hypothetical protein